MLLFCLGCHCLHAHSTARSLSTRRSPSDGSPYITKPCVIFLKLAYMVIRSPPIRAASSSSRGRPNTADILGTSYSTELTTMPAGYVTLWDGILTKFFSFRCTFSS